MKKLVLITMLLAANFVAAKATNPTGPFDTTKPFFQTGTLCDLLDSNEKQLAVSDWTILLKIFPEMKKNGQWGERIERNTNILLKELSVAGLINAKITINKPNFGDFEVIVTDEELHQTFTSNQNMNFMPSRHGGLIHFSPAFNSTRLAGFHVQCHRN